MKAGTTGPDQILWGATAERYLGIEIRDRRKEILHGFGFRVRTTQKAICLGLSLQVKGRSGGF